LKRKQRTKEKDKGKGQRKRTKEKDKGKGQRKRTKEKDKGTWPAKFISGFQIYSPLQEGFRLSPGI